MFLLKRTWWPRVEGTFDLHTAKGTNAPRNRRNMGAGRFLTQPRQLQYCVQCLLPLCANWNNPLSINTVTQTSPCGANTTIQPAAVGERHRQKVARHYQGTRVSRKVITESSSGSDYIQPVCYVWQISSALDAYISSKSYSRFNYSSTYPWH
jgi:hypothetical protein